MLKIKLFCDDNHNLTLPDNIRQTRRTIVNILAKIILKPQSNSVDGAFCHIADNA